LRIGGLRNITNKPLATSFPVSASIRENGSKVAGFNPDWVTITGSAFSRTAQTHSGLKSGTRYTLEFATGGTVVSRLCFRTTYAGGDMNTPFSGSGNIGGTSGCFALGGEYMGGSDAAIRACFCGARNRLGQWARTGTVEPGTNLTDDATYRWMLSATERTRRGCTTN